jgi:hypothetical protein
VILELWIAVVQLVIAIQASPNEQKVREGALDGSISPTGCDGECTPGEPLAAIKLGEN